MHLHRGTYEIKRVGGLEYHVDPWLRVVAIVGLGGFAIFV